MKRLGGYAWLLCHPEQLLYYHEIGQHFLATAHDGVVIATDDEEEFYAELNDIKPSYRAKLHCTHTFWWVVGR